jgi:hypothetical protein
MMDKENKSLSIFKWSWVLFMVAATSAPYLVYFLATPAGYQYTWILPPYPEDLLSYLAWSQQAASGSILFKLKYTALPHPAFLLHPLFLLFGFMSSWSGVEVNIVHFVMKALGVILFWLIFFRYIAYLKLNAFESMAASVMVGISSGFGWLAHVYGVYHKSADLLFPGLNTYFAFMWNPLFPYSFALILLVVYLLDSGTGQAKQSHAWLSGLSVGLLALIHPYDIPLLYTLAISVILIRLRSRAPGFLLRFFISSLPFVLMEFLISKFHPLASRHSLQGNMPSLPLLAYLFGFGLPLLIVGAGVMIDKIKIIKKYHILFLWICLGVFLGYLPFWFQRSCMSAVHVPICILAGLSLNLITAKLIHAKIKVWILYGSLLVLIPLLTSTQIFILAEQWKTVSKNIKGYYFISDSLISGFDFLKRNSNQNDIVFASLSTSKFIPAFSGNSVVWGHWAMSVDYLDRLEWFKSLMKQKSGEYTRQHFRETGIRYIYLDGMYKQYFHGKDGMWLVTGARKVFENDGVIIYREEPVPNDNPD